MRKPDFEANLKKILLKRKPARPTPFEFLISEDKEIILSNYTLKNDSLEERIKRKILAYYNAGYDYVPFILGDMWFQTGSHNESETYSLNDGGVITDIESYEKYVWPKMENVSYKTLELASKHLPDGMKILSYCPGGILENAIALCGYEDMCYLFADEPELITNLFYEIGWRTEKLIKATLDFDTVGMTFINDDWGFKNGTMISPKDLKRLVYPHYREIAKATHEKGKVIGMHSCGNFKEIFSDLYLDIGFDGKHSYEDTIVPVEQAYAEHGGKIAILGGIDMNFLCRATEEEIQKRCYSLLEQAETLGGYALGSGNSIAKYVPFKNYIAMLKTVNPDIKF